MEAHPFAMEFTRTDISIFSTEKPGEMLYYVDTTVTNARQKKNTEPKKIVRCQQYCMLRGPIAEWDCP